MILGMFTIFDEKAQFHNKPFYFAHDGEAKRMVADLVLNSDFMISKHPGDFKLYKLGTFNDATGKTEQFDIPQLVCNATEFIVTAQEIKDGVEEKSAVESV